MKKVLTLSLFLFIFTGCQSTSQWLKTKPIPFQNGYNAGCKNGTDMASYSYIFKTNNTPQYKNDKIYQEAWDEGYYDCYTDTEFDRMTRRRF